MILVLVHVHSKWIEAFVTASATFAVVIEELHFTFSQFGLPQLNVSDNGLCFTSDEFELFMKKNGIKHITSAPYHHASKGLTEQAVQIIKCGLRKVVTGTLRARIATVLCSHRITPQVTTGVPPCALLLRRRLRMRLDFVLLNTAGHVESKQLQQMQAHDATAKSWSFVVGSKMYMYVRNYVSGDTRQHGYQVRLRRSLVHCCMLLNWQVDTHEGVTLINCD